MTPLTIDAAARTDIGLIRRRNEDAGFAGRALFAVADGLGGHPAGDVASTTVIETLRRHDHEVSPSMLADVLGQAVHEANSAVGRKIESSPELAGMGTTLVAALVSGSTIAVANVGDSRAYLLRGGHLTRLTEDHTYGNLLAQASEVPRLPERIARFIDGRAEGRSPDIVTKQLRSGDRLLLCSDGLSGVVPTADIEEVLRSDTTSDETAEQLIAMATELGGPDNITVVVVSVELWFRAASSE